MKKLLIIAAVILTSTQAFATNYEVNEKGGQTFVWKAGGGMDRGLKLILNGVHKTNPALVARELACVVEGRAKVVITDAGFASHTILVTSGPNSGCEGDIAAEDLDR